MNKTRTMPQSRKTPEISTSDAVDIVAKSVSEIAFVAVSSLVNVQPVWALIFLTAKGIYSAWGEFGQAKLNELVTDLEKAKNSFDPKVIETDEFKSVFLSALERHMKESSEMKRKLLRNYLISVGQGKMPGFDYHTKLLSILDQITGDELRLFMLLPNIIEDSSNELFSLATNKQLAATELRTREVEMNVLQVKMRLKNWRIKTKNLSALIRFLSNYGLIISQDVSAGGIGGGGATDVTFQGITEVGKVFYDFIDDSLFDKEIITYVEYEKNPALSGDVFED